MPRRLGLVPLAAAVSLAAAAPPASALVLESGVAVVDVDPSSEQVTGWTVNGVAHLRTQQLWVRLPWESAERPITAFSLLASAASDGDGDGRDDALAASYVDADQRLRVDLAWRLAGSAIGDPAVSSSLTLDVTLTPLGAPLVVALFEYDDVDLFTSFADDEAQLEAPDRAVVTDASGLGSWRSEWGLAPDSVEVATWDQTLASLSDGAITALSGATSASGDVTITASWLVSLGGLAAAFSQTQTIAVVPEPGAALLVGLGLAVLARARKGAAR